MVNRVRVRVTPSSILKFEEAKYPLLDVTHPLTIALIVVGIGCDVLPGDVPSVTATKSIYYQMKTMKKGINDNHEICICLVR